MESEQAVLRTADKTVFDLTSDAVVVVEADDDGFRAVHVNQAFIHGMGVTRDEIVGRRLRDALPHPFSDEMHEQLRRVVHGCEPRSHELTQETRAGRRTYAMSHWPLLANDGRCRYVVSVTRDLTELRQAQVAVTELEEQSNHGLWLWDLVDDRLHWSPQLYRIFGLRPGQLRPSFDGFLERIHPDDVSRVRQVIERARQTGSSYAHRYRILRPDGEVRHVLGRGRLTLDASGTPVRMAGTARDVTSEHRQALRQLDGLRGTPGIPETLQALPSTMGEGQQIAWLLTPRAELEQQSPLAWLACQRPAGQVLWLARHEQPRSGSLAVGEPGARTRGQ